MKFDIIIGNVPHQEPGKRSHGHSIWHKLVTASLTELADDGYLCYVHPPGWRRPLQTRHDLFNELTRDRQMVYLNINDKHTGKKVFGYTTRYDYYVVHNVKAVNPTTVIDEVGVEMKLDLYSFPYLPNHSFSLFQKIISGHGRRIQSKCVRTHRLVYDYMNSTETEEFRYPICDKTPKRELNLCYSSKLHEAHGKPKVLFDRNGKVNAVFDRVGQYGTTQNTYFVEVDTELEGEILTFFMNSKLMEYVVKMCKWSNFEIEYMMFRNFPIPVFDHVPCEEELWDYFKLSAEEIELIK